MDVEQIITTFTTKGSPLPKTALLAAVARRKEITPRLLELLSAAGRDIDTLAGQKNNGSST